MCPPRDSALDPQELQSPEASQLTSVAARVAEIDQQNKQAAAASAALQKRSLTASGGSSSEGGSEVGGDSWRQWLFDTAFDELAPWFKCAAYPPTPQSALSLQLPPARAPNSRPAGGKCTMSCGLSLSCCWRGA